VVVVLIKLPKLHWPSFKCKLKAQKTLTNTESSAHIATQQLPVVRSNSGKKLASLWRVVASVILFLLGMGIAGWSGLQLLHSSEVPECVYLVDEQRQLLKQELTQLDQAELTSQENDSTTETENSQIVAVTENETAGSSAQLVPNYSSFGAEALGKIVVQIAGAVVNPGVYQLLSTQRIGDLIQVAGGFTEDADQQTVIKQFNLAARLKDEQRVYIPLKQEQELADWLGQYCGLMAQNSLPPASNQGASTTNTTNFGSTNANTSNPSQTSTVNNVTPTTTTTTTINNNTQDGTAITDNGQTTTNQNNCISINEASSEALQTLSGVGPATATLIIDGRPYLNISELLEVKGIGQATLEKLEPFICL